MINMATEELIRILRTKSDAEYKAFNDRLINTRLETIGVRLPEIRRIAKEYQSSLQKLLDELPGLNVYEAVMAVGIMISRAHIDIDGRMNLYMRLLPYVDSWAITDSIVYKPSAAEQGPYLEFLKELLLSEKTFTVRFAVVSLYKYIGAIDVLSIFESVNGGEYYVDMAVAWGLCELLVFDYDNTLKSIEERRFSKFIHNKAIRKAIESYRISDSRKQYLRTLIIK